MELPKPHAEVARLKRENDIIKKQRRTSRGIFCGVRLDGRTKQDLRVDRNVHRARRQYQRLSRMEAWRHARSQTTHGCETAGRDSLHSCGTHRCLWQPAYGARTAAQRVHRWQKANGIRARHKRRYNVTTDSKHGLPVAANLFNREVSGWSLKPRMTTDIVTDALTMARFRRRPDSGVMHHSDRGNQNASHAF